jgi:hypothetical protein
VLVWIQNHPYESIVLLVAVLTFILGWFQYRKKEASPQSADYSPVINASDSEVAVSQQSKSPITDAVIATGSGNTQHVNSHNVNYTIPILPSGAPGRERSDEWRELTNELHEAFGQIGYAFIPINVLTPGHEENDYEAGIRRGYRVIRNRLFIADALTREKISEKYQGLVDYARSARTAKPYQPDCPTMRGFDLKTSAFEDELMEIARRDIGQPSSKPAPADPQKAERPVPNLVRAGSEQRYVYLGRWDFQGIADPATEGERKVAIPALLLRFENKVLSDRKIGRANSVIAKMRFLRPVGNSTSERAVDYGIWLNAKSNSTGMDAGDTSELVLMCFVNDKLLSFRDKRNGNRNFGAESFSYFTRVDVSNFDRVEVTIIDQNSQSHLTATLKYWYKDEAFYVSEV